jgi:hypothetical protein
VELATAIVLWRSFCFQTLMVVLSVLLLELAFRLHPVVQIATVNSAAFDVNLKRSLTDFCRGRPVVACFFWDVRLNTSRHLRLDFVISCCLLPLRGFPLTSTVTLHVRIPAGVDPLETRLNDDGGCPRTQCREKSESLRQSREMRSSEPPSCASFNSRRSSGDFARCAWRP